MRNVFEYVFEGMSKGVHRIDAPFVSRAVMLGKTDTVNRRVAQVDIAGSHVNLRAEHHASFRMFAFTHFAEKSQALFGRTISEGRIHAGCVQRAAVFFDLFSALFVDVSQAVFNQMLGNFVHIVEIIAGEVVVGFFGVFPVETEPVDGAENRVDVLLIFFDRVGIVETHMAASGVVLGQTEVQTDTFSVTDVEIAVGLGRKTKTDFRLVDRTFHLFRVGAGMSTPMSGIVYPLLQVFVNNVAKKISDVAALSLFFVFGHRCAKKITNLSILPFRAYLRRKYSVL